jgi:glutamine amidotransferase
MPLSSRGVGPTAIVDYGLCNLASVARALRHLGSEPVITSDPDELRAASRVVLPGVGAFGTAMANLRERALVAPLQEYAASGRPLIGLCLGMQLLMDESDEGGLHRGLGIIAGRCARLPRAPGYKVPHIGWSGLEPAARPWTGTVLGRSAPGDTLYFVHSFHVLPVDERDVLAYTTYGALRYCSVLARGSVYGCQAHPEKSSRTGLALLESFLSL